MAWMMNGKKEPGLLRSDNQPAFLSQDLQPSQNRRLWNHYVIRGLLLMSIFLNFWVLYQWNEPKETHLGRGWAGLKYEIPTPLYSSTEYGPAIGTDEDRDRLWEAIDWSNGVLAISDSEAEHHGLPLSGRFPWDNSKGVYLLGSHHQIHCLKGIYKYISRTHQGLDPNVSYHHVLHCMDTILQDAYCHADDTPWMQLPPKPDRERYAKFQTRQCRSWDKLMHWAKQYNSCYRQEDSESGDEAALERFGYCPESSPYAETAASVLRSKAAE